MVERKINICDLCEDRAAKTKCDVCKKDLCNTCAKKVAVYYNNIQIEVCKRCERKGRKLMENKEFSDQLKKQTSKLIQSSNILEGLEDEEEDSYA